MNQTQPVYDSMVVGGLRMARRRWYLVVIATVCGLLLGFLLTSDATYVGESSLRIVLDAVKVPGEKIDKTQPTIDPIALGRRVGAQIKDLDLSDDIEATVIGDNTAGSLSITTTAPTENSALDATKQVGKLAAEIAVNEASQSTITRIDALTGIAANADARVTQLDEQLEALSSSGANPGATNSLVVARLAASQAAADAHLELALTQSQLEGLDSRLVTLDEPVVTYEGAGPLVPAALGVLFGLLALVVLVTVSSLDGKLRRRVHLEAATSHAAVLGVTTSSPNEADRALLRQSISRFASGHRVSDILLTPVGSGSIEGLESLEAPDVNIETTSLEQATGRYGDPGVGVVFVVPFGKISESAYQAVVANAMTAGQNRIATILTMVPPRDQAWSSVSLF